MLLLTYKKEELNWLPEKLGSIHELITYLTRLNDNIMVYVKEIYIGIEDNVKAYLMSDGLTYTEHSNGRWFLQKYFFIN
ncbi:MAG: hypothetical protein ABI405_03670 [Parafilimonas sp.]